MKATERVETRYTQCLSIDNRRDPNHNLAPEPTDHGTLDTSLKILYTDQSWTFKDKNITQKMLDILQQIPW